MKKILIPLLLVSLTISGVLTSCGGPSEGAAERHILKGNEYYNQGRFNDSTE